jgi:hypothetical protein
MGVVDLLRLKYDGETIFVLVGEALLENAMAGRHLVR